MGYRLRLLVLAALDALIVTVAVIFAYLLRFEFQIQPQYRALLPYVIISHIILILIAFNRFKMYRRVWQYASVGELVSLVKAATVSEVVFYVFHSTVQSYFPKLIVPRSIYLLSWAFIILGVGGLRFAWRIFRDSYLTLNLRSDRRRTLIIGAGQAGVLIAKELKQSPDSELYPVAFIDDGRTKWNLEVLGLPVLGGRAQIPEVVSEYRIQNIVIAIPSASRTEIANIIDICKTTKAKIKILPRVSDLISGNISVNMIREVSLEDLLGRDPVRVDLEGIADYLTGRVVLVTGAGGSIGAEICRQVCPFGPQKLLLLGHGENSLYDIELELARSFPGVLLETIIADIQDRQRIREVFDTYRPSVVFHAAAHKHVPLMERNPVEAVKNNIIGTKNMAECAHEYNALRFVLISTDKAVNPTSVMGATKRVSEMFVQGMARVSQTKFVAVRFGNVLGSRGSVIPLFQQQIQQGGPVTVTHLNMVRYFMTIPEAVQLVIQTGALARGGEIFILDMGQPVRIVDLARDLIRLSGLAPDEDIKIIYTGIRPGEKLYEEILTSEEGISATRHNRIFIGKPSDPEMDQLQFMIRKLEQVIARKDVTNQAKEIRDLLRQIIPSFQSEPAQAGTVSQGLAAVYSKEQNTVIRELQYGNIETAVSKTETATGKTETAIGKMETTTGKMGEDKD